MGTRTSGSPCTRPIAGQLAATQIKSIPELSSLSRERADHLGGGVNGDLRGFPPVLNVFPHHVTAQPSRVTRIKSPLDSLHFPELDPAEDARGVINDLRAVPEVSGELL